MLTKRNTARSPIVHSDPHQTLTKQHMAPRWPPAASGRLCSPRESPSLITVAAGGGVAMRQSRGLASGVCGPAVDARVWMLFVQKFCAKSNVRTSVRSIWANELRRSIDFGLGNSQPPNEARSSRVRAREGASVRKCHRVARTRARLIARPSDRAQYP